MTEPTPPAPTSRTTEGSAAASPSAGPAAPPGRARIDAPGKRPMDMLPLLYLLGFLVLGGSLVYLYSHPVEPPVREADTLRPQIDALTTRLAQLEARPVPTLAPVEGRIAALEGRIAGIEAKPAPTPPPPVDLGPVNSRLEALTTRLDAAATKDEVRPLSAKLDEAAAKDEVRALSTRLDTLVSRLDTVESRLSGAEQQAKTAATQATAQLTSQVNAVTEASRRLSRLQAAATALEAGQKLGEIPGAPPALARFASETPPTEATLRLSFDDAAAAAARASQPAIMEDKPFASRLWNRAQQAVTLRQGDRILLGDPVSGILARAKQLVEAGDLQGALKALDGLAGPAAAAMQPWADQARALLDARAALAQMARG